MTRISIPLILLSLFNLLTITSALILDPDTCNNACVAVQDYLRNLSLPLENSVDDLLKKNPSDADVLIIKGNYSYAVKEAMEHIHVATDPSTDEFCNEFIQLCSQGDSTTIGARDTSTVEAVTMALSMLKEQYVQLGGQPDSFHGSPQLYCGLIQQLATLGLFPKILGQIYCEMGVLGLFLSTITLSASALVRGLAFPLTFILEPLGITLNSGDFYNFTLPELR